MADITELAFQICRYMFENKFTGANVVTAGDVQKALNLTPDDFNTADDYLRETKYYDATFGGDAAQLTLKASGINFVNRTLINRLDLSSDAEKLAVYLVNKQKPRYDQFTLSSLIKTDLQWGDEQYLDACQILFDEGFLEESRSARYLEFQGLLLNSDGRKAVRRNFRRSEPAMNVNTGNINVESSSGVAINAGNNNNISQYIQNTETNQFFEEIIRQVEKQQDLSADEKKEIKDAIELAQDEAAQNTPNEKKLASYFRNIAAMIPDILDIAIAAVTTPSVGPLPVTLVIAKKVSDKAKTDVKKKKID